MDYDSIKSLTKLLKTEDESDSEDELLAAGHSRIGPGHIGPVKRTNNEEELEKDRKRDPKEIWDDEEVAEMQYDEHNDHRKKPEYDIKYRQSVTPEDIYLQVGFKTPLSSSCEDMVVTVDLKGESSDRIVLNVQPTSIDIRSPLYRLALPLPHEVDPNSGSAKWDEEKSMLTITLRIIRELDFINF
ncbi:dynein axonemal assembly factor 6 [Hetaerina americana]|uniref:dynein axonemal assembly factor 6 n=1 Tax=Hetaerina americana TaxID=62018 RepID=UPI003A7F47C6